LYVVAIMEILKKTFSSEELSDLLIRPDL